MSQGKKVACYLFTDTGDVKDIQVIKEIMKKAAMVYGLDDEPVFYIDAGKERRPLLFKLFEDCKVGKAKQILIEDIGALNDSITKAVECIAEILLTGAVVYTLMGEIINGVTVMEIRSTGDD